MVDALSHMLGAVRLNDACFFSHDASSWPQNIPLPLASAAASPAVEQVIECHLVTSGSCWGGLADEPALRLELGDLIAFPRGGRQLRSAGRVQLICGLLRCDAPAFNPMLTTLPRLIHLRAADHNHSFLMQLIEVALAQASSPISGRSCILSRLGELLLAEVIRRYVACLPQASAGWFAGLRDENIGRALQQIHERPAHPWSLGELARQAGLSRSMLAERFAQIVGVPPIQYLAQWRIQLAASLLRTGNSSLAEVAQCVGYGSEAALSRAFKRCVGVAPAHYRNGCSARQARPADEFRPPTETFAAGIRSVAGIQRRTA